MRKAKVLYFLCAAVGLLAHPGPAAALELRISSKTADPGDSIAVEITAQEYNQETVAAAVFTVTYNADQLVLNSIDSDFFSTFLEQWNATYPIPNPLPPVSGAIKSAVFDTLRRSFYIIPILFPVPVCTINSQGEHDPGIFR
ncbi:MAG: hypothetical protein D3913_14585, partial [Candidatus Electrothrix sp. LOE1_4_5]|nr:hypothetical protein [Candidatus Electrothrix gigas]